MTTSTFNLDDTSASGPLDAAPATVIGTENADILIGAGVNNVFYGLGGADFILGGVGNDTFVGGAGADHMDGSTGINKLSYFGSDAGVLVDLLTDMASGGHAEGDTFANIQNISGSSFDDFFVGDAANNRLFGGGGSDTLDGGEGRDHLTGGRGHDILYGRSGNDYLKGGVGVDYLVGNTGNDTLEGGNGRDTLIGGRGRDFLKGGLHADTLLGGNGHDFLWGGYGQDTMTGGAGHDTFVFFESRDSQGTFNSDVITDFESGVDRLNFDSVFRGPYQFIGSDAFSGTSGEVRAFSDGADTIVRVDVDGDGAGDMRIVLQNVASIDVFDVLGII